MWSRLLEMLLIAYDMGTVASTASVSWSGSSLISSEGNCSKSSLHQWFFGGRYKTGSSNLDNFNGHWASRLSASTRLRHRFNAIWMARILSGSLQNTVSTSLWPYNSPASMMRNIVGYLSWLQFMTDMQEVCPLAWVAFAASQLKLLWQWFGYILFYLFLRIWECEKIIFILWIAQ